MERQTDILLGLLILIGVIIILYLNSIKSDTLKIFSFIDMNSTCEDLP